MFSALDISTSALVAQRTRMTAIAGNIANISTTHNELGQPEPYKPRYVVFQADNSIGQYGASGSRLLQFAWKVIAHRAISMSPDTRMRSSRGL